MAQYLIWHIDLQYKNCFFFSNTWRLWSKLGSIVVLLLSTLFSQTLSIWWGFNPFTLLLFSQGNNNEGKRYITRLRVYPRGAYLYPELSQGHINKLHTCMGRVNEKLNESSPLLWYFTLHKHSVGCTRNKSMDNILGWGGFDTLSVLYKLKFAPFREFYMRFWLTSI